jgi:hypothetical protein
MDLLLGGLDGMVVGFVDFVALLCKLLELIVAFG